MSVFKRPFKQGLETPMEEKYIKLELKEPTIEQEESIAESFEEEPDLKPHFMDVAIDTEYSSEKYISIQLRCRGLLFNKPYDFQIMILEPESRQYFESATGPLPKIHYYYEAINRVPDDLCLECIFKTLKQENILQEPIPEDMYLIINLHLYFSVKDLTAFLGHDYARELYMQTK